MALSRLRSLPIPTVNRLSARYFHDCSVSDTHPVRLLLLGSPVRLIAGSISERVEKVFKVVMVANGL